MKQAVCPQCRKEFDVEETRAMPFCSERCRLIDLGKWLDESYSLPADDVMPAMDEPPQRPPAG